MSVEANEEAVRKHIDLSWNKAEFGALAEVVARRGGPPLGRERSERPGRAQGAPSHCRAGWTERHCEIEALVGEGDLVANRWSFRASDPTGGRWVMSGMDFYRFEAGRIVEEWIALGNACGRDDLLERLLARLELPVIDPAGVARE